jgi:hypothetical protein
VGISRSLEASQAGLAIGVVDIVSPSCPPVKADRVYK